MKVFLNIDESFPETKVTIESPALDDDVQGILNLRIHLCGSEALSSLMESCL